MVTLVSKQHDKLEKYVKWLGLRAKTLCNTLKFEIEEAFKTGYSEGYGDGYEQGYKEHAWNSRNSGVDNCVFFAKLRCLNCKRNICKSHVFDRCIYKENDTNFDAIHHVFEDIPLARCQAGVAD